MNIKMGLKIFGVMYWIPLTKDSNKWQGLVNLAMYRFHTGPEIWL
jgi:hypothetical protein